VRELLAAGRREVSEIWLTEGNDPSPILGEIDRLAREAHVPVRLVSPRRLESVQGTDTPQGVVAFAEPLTAVTLDELVLGHRQERGASIELDSAVDVEIDDHDIDDIDDDLDDDFDDEDFDIFIDADDFESVDDSDAGEDDSDAGEDDSDAGDPPDAEDEPDDAADANAMAAEESAAPEQAAGFTEAVVPDEPAAPSDENVASDEDAEAEGGDEADAVNPAAEAVEAIERAGWVSESTRKTAEAVEKGTDRAFLIVLEGVTDPQNLGAILRTAECAGATGVAVPRHRSVHVTPAVTKAAAGAIEHLPMALVAGVPSALQDLERLGVMTVGLDERGTSSLFDVSLGDRPVALVLGSEGTGLSSLARRRCDVLCRIPLAGEIPSLNVSAAAAVACFEVARQRGNRASSSR
jgi:predicted rRNA methylase